MAQVGEPGWNMLLHILTEYPRRLVTSCLLYGAAFHIWSSFVFVEYDDDDDTSQEPENESNIQHYHNHQHIERNDEDEGDFNKDQLLGGLDPERTTFIPLSWPLLREGDYYAGSDPEWQEFVRISKDAQKIGKLKGVCYAGFCPGFVGFMLTSFPR